MPQSNRTGDTLVIIRDCTASTGDKDLRLAEMPGDWNDRVSSVTTQMGSGTHCEVQPRRVLPAALRAAKEVCRGHPRVGCGTVLFAAGPPRVRSFRRYAIGAQTISWQRTSWPAASLRPPPRSSSPSSAGSSSASRGRLRPHPAMSSKLRRRTGSARSKAAPAQGLPHLRLRQVSLAGAEEKLRQLDRSHGQHTAVDLGIPTTRRDRWTHEDGLPHGPEPRSRTSSKKRASNTLQNTIKCRPAYRSPVRLAAGKAPVSVLPHEHQEEALHSGQPTGAPDRRLVCMRVHVEEP